MASGTAGRGVPGRARMHPEPNLGDQNGSYYRLKDITATSRRPSRGITTVGQALILTIS